VRSPRSAVELILSSFFVLPLNFVSLSVNFSFRLCFLPSPEVLADLCARFMLRTLGVLPPLFRTGSRILEDFHRLPTSYTSVVVPEPLRREGALSCLLLPLLLLPSRSPGFVYLVFSSLL